jgi:hypothetical protein
MGCASTMVITKNDAMKEILKRLPNADDNTIAAVLECLASCNERYNFSICSSYRNIDTYVIHRYDQDGLEE